VQEGTAQPLHNQVLRVQQALLHNAPLVLLLLQMACARSCCCFACCQRSSCRRLDVVAGFCWCVRQLSRVAT
jgi:hypothetical protein